MNNFQLSSSFTILLLISLLGISGCGGSASSPDGVLAKANETNMQRLANLYTKFQSTHSWNGPQDEAEFKEFVRNFDAEKLKRIGVDANDTDQLFISERDGEPFKIRFSIKGGPRGCSEPAIFETTGNNGQRMVGFLNMIQREVDDSEYDKLWAGQVSEPAAPTNPAGR